MKNKKLLTLSIATLLSLGTIVGCGNTNPSIDNTSSNDSINEPSNDNSTVISEESISNDTTSNNVTSEDTDSKLITIKNAIDLVMSNSEGYKTSDKYKIRGTIKSISNNTYGNMIITDGTNDLTVYGSYNEDGTKRFDAMDNKPSVGDEILIYGVLMNYKGTTPEIVDGWILEIKKGDVGGNTGEVNPSDGTLVIPEGFGKEYSYKTIKEAAVLAGTDESKTTEESYYVIGKVSTIKNTTYGNMTITDGVNELTIYGTYDSTGSNRYDAMSDKPVVGDIVIFYGQLTYYKGLPEIKDAKVFDIYKEEAKVDDTYLTMDVLHVRNESVNKHVITEGVVAQITYANGKVPNGFFLVDSTSSIYVYGDIALSVSVGNKVKVAGTKTLFIADTEKASAEKWGYKGCNQISEAILMENDKGSHDFDTSWIDSTYVREIVTNDCKTDFTTIIYKVDAIIRKVPGDGFVNYYINDFDDKTGSYVYTACNGSDFAWLDQYDGKVVSLYVSVINAKSTAQGEVYRFVPIKVVGESSFNKDNQPYFINEYYGICQFKDQYDADPSLELTTSVTNEFIGANEVALTYKSDNEDVCKFVEEDGKMVMHLVNYGKAFIEVTVTTNGVTSTCGKTIEYKEAKEITSITVKKAIETEIGQKVTVKGIVGPSLVNQVGFYLFDETGVIAVKTDSESIKGVHLGDEVILTGDRTQFNSTDSLPGQACIIDSTIELNEYGNHQVNIPNVIEGKTLEELIAIPASEDHSTEVYKVKVKITKTSSGYSTNYNLYGLNDNSKYLGLYSGSGAQYSWLDEFTEYDEVEILVSLCNWNKKSAYKGCVLAVITSEKTVYNTLNFAK